MCYFYIIYSKDIDSYYTGHSCEDLVERIRKHNSNHRGYTGKADDWILLFSERYGDKSAAYAREREVKSWKSRKRIEHLIFGSD
ncbi:GIY-YIG nuclease family protein [Maribacter sp. 2210JD10-5]|uniref:GIY-YIG nuclease family protein n=1 Tax=Maribacter sp. 2210JD10-5 TaxID=3386272 RepID=UPI0039BC6EB7